jgi:hypothetical protein
VLLAQFDKSGMTGKRFAAWSGINYQTLCGWLQKRRKAAVSQGLAVTGAPGAFNGYLGGQGVGPMSFSDSTILP